MQKCSFFTYCSRVCTGKVDSDNRFYAPACFKDKEKPKENKMGREDYDEEAYQRGICFDEESYYGDNEVIRSNTIESSSEDDCESQNTKRRPDLHLGDLVKFSRRYPYGTQKELLLVLDLALDGSKDGHSRVKIFRFATGKTEVIKRKFLWSTGKNLELRSREVCLKKSEPKYAQKLIDENRFDRFFYLGFHLTYPELVRSLLPK